MRYYSTFLTGFQEIVKQALQKKSADVTIDLVLDGLIVYQTEKPADFLRNIRIETT